MAAINNLIQQGDLELIRKADQEQRLEANLTRCRTLLSATDLSASVIESSTFIRYFFQRADKSGRPQHVRFSFQRSGVLTSATLHSGWYDPFFSDQKVNNLSD